MADDPESKAADTNKDGEAAKNKRRVLQPATEPTTLRQQSERAQAKSGRERNRNRVGRIMATPFRLIGRMFQLLGKFRFFRAIGYVLAPPYIRNAWRELRLVTWPNARQTRRLTFAVVVFSLIFGGIVAIVDYGLDKLFRALILN